MVPPPPPSSLKSKSKTPSSGPGINMTQQDCVVWEDENTEEHNKLVKQLFHSTPRLIQAVKGGKICSSSASSQKNTCGNNRVYVNSVSACSVYSSNVVSSNDSKIGLIRSLSSSHKKRNGKKREDEVDGIFELLGSSTRVDSPMVGQSISAVVANNNEIVNNNNHCKSNNHDSVVRHSPRASGVKLNRRRRVSLDSHSLDSKKIVMKRKSDKLHHLSPGRNIIRKVVNRRKNRMASSLLKSPDGNLMQNPSNNLENRSEVSSSFKDQAIIKDGNSDETNEIESEHRNDSFSNILALESTKKAVPALVEKSYTCDHSFNNYITNEESSSPFDPYADSTVEFDDALLLQMDKMVAARQTNNNNEISKTSNLNGSVTNGSLKQTDEDDPYGFPAMDFEAMDKAIEEAVDSNMSQSSSPPIDYASFSRYRVEKIESNDQLYTKVLHVSKFLGDQIRGNSPLPTNQIILKGEWYYMKVDPKNLVHLVSVKNKSDTSFDSLPRILDTNPLNVNDEDDVIIVVNPEVIITPTMISESVDCSRRAVLKYRMGSSGISSRSALIGIMRHEVFERCLKDKVYNVDRVKLICQKVIENHKEELIAINVSYSDAFDSLKAISTEVLKFMHSFVNPCQQQANNLVPIYRGAGRVNINATDVYATEESVVSVELGMKGFVDATLSVIANVGGSKNTLSLMPFELKTGHNQNVQTAHTAQLSLYVLLMQLRHGFVKSHSNNFSNSSSAAENVGANGGVLLYLNDKGSKAVHISPAMSEIRSLIGQRNIASYDIKASLAPRGVEYVKDQSGKGEDIIKIHPSAPTELPDGLGNSRSCFRCFSNKECALYAKSAINFGNANGGVNVTNTFNNDLVEQVTGHLTEIDIQYFRDWDRLIDLETKDSNRSIAEAWLIPACEREKTGKCIASLYFDENYLDIDSPSRGDYALIKFIRSSSSHSISQAEIVLSKIERGDYAVISVDISESAYQRLPSRFIPHQAHLVRGEVYEVSGDSVYLLSPSAEVSRLRQFVTRFKKDANILFRLDKDEIMTGSSTMRHNLLKFFTGHIQVSSSQANDMNNSQNDSLIAFSHRMSRLRELVIHLRPPQFQEDDPNSMFSSPFSASQYSKEVVGCDFMDLLCEYAEMNPDQKAAIQKVLSSRDYTLIQGLPGTGKTSTISFITRLLVARGKRVLLSSYTHSAVDNLMLKLIASGVGSDGSMLRIGSRNSLHEDIQKYLPSEVVSAQFGGSDATIESLKSTVDNASIVGVTALTVAKSPLLIGQHFDVVIVDEAGQINQPAILGSLMFADSFVLVGDHMQLPPLVNNAAAEEAGFGVSMMSRLCDSNPSAVAQLTLQYRMHSDICQLSNKIAYNGTLKCGNEGVATKLLDLPHYFHASADCPVADNVWLKRFINPQMPVVFGSTDCISNGCALEISGGKRSHGGTVINKFEAFAVKMLVQSFLSNGADLRNIGIISPYRSQVGLLKSSSVLGNFITRGLEISTVDRYQGRDKSIIILSFVRSNLNGKVGKLLNDFRRINVAFSRAKQKMIMIGSLRTLRQGSTVLAPAIDMLERKRWIDQVAASEEFKKKMSSL